MFLLTEDEGWREDNLGGKYTVNFGWEIHSKMDGWNNNFIYGMNNNSLYSLKYC